MSDPERSVRLGVLAAPGLPEDVTARIADDLAEDLREAYGSLGWHTELVVNRLAVPPAPTTELIDAARRALLAAGLGPRSRGHGACQCDSAAAPLRGTSAARTASHLSRSPHSVSYT